jgi:hypothetical protein
LTAVFIAHTKVLTAIRLSSKNKKVEINVPKVEHFLFKVLCETSKLLWSSTYLFRDGIPGIEKQQNYRTIEGILNEGILQAVRSLVPVKSILRDFVNMDSSDHTTEDESDDENMDKKEDKKEDTVNSLSSPPVLTAVKEKEDTVNSLSSPSLLTAVKEKEDRELLLKNAIIQPQVLIEKEETKEEVNDVPQTIIIEDKPNVRFGQFDAVFDLDHPSDSEMIYDPKESDSEEQVPDLEILDESGVPLSDGIDFQSLDSSDESNQIETDDYEEL